MSVSPLISVIVPFFNAAFTINECLASVSSQTGVDFEVIAVDDGSTDDGASIAELYARSDKRFRCVRQDNSGVSVARNTGIDLAIGDYISFVDADDILLPGALGAMLKAVDEDTDLVIASHNSFRRIGSFTVKSGTTSLTESKYALDGSEPIDALDSYLSTPWAKLYRSKTLKDNGVRFEAGVPIGEDTRFNIEFCKHANGLLRTSSDVVYGYALGGGASTKTFYPHMLSLYAELYDAYVSSVPMFSTRYVCSLWGRFADASLLHLYSHCSGAKARALASQELPFFLARAPHSDAYWGNEKCASSTDSMEALLLDWENRNRVRILKGRIKQMGRELLCR